MIGSGSVIVSWDFSKGKDDGILIVGEKGRIDSMDILNVFIGEEAEELHKKLTTKDEELEKLYNKLSDKRGENE